MINIGGSNSQYDAHYRYKRNKLDIKREKNGTVLVNIGIVAKQLNTKSESIIKYLQKILGLSINDNVIRGTIDLDILEKQLQKYIAVYILCPKCLTPELDETGETCKACNYTKKPILSVKMIDEEDEKEKPINPHDIVISKLLHYLYDLFPDYEKKFIYEVTMDENKVCYNLNCEKEKCKKIHVEKLEILSKCIEYCWHEEKQNDSNYKINKINKMLTKIGIPIYKS